MGKALANTGIRAVLLVGPLLIVAGRPYVGNPVVAPEAPQSPKRTYTYKVVGGHEIRADVYRLPGDDVRPVVVWIHGGALILGTRDWLPADQLQIYLQAGYALVSVDYRLAPETKLAAIIEDLADAYAWVRTEGPDLFQIDPNRIAVVGHSAGGYLALVAGFRLTPRPDAVVSFYGYGDISGPWYSEPDPFYNRSPPVTRDHAYLAIGDSVISSTPTRLLTEQRSQFYVYCRQQGLWPVEISGHHPDTDRAWFAQYEPIHNVTSDYPPTLLLHGEKDTDVPFAQSALMAEAFRHHGVAHDLVAHAEWGHGFDLIAGMTDHAIQQAFKRILSFFAEHVR